MNIILMGPIGVGKTTVSKILAKELSIKHISLDSLRRGKYYEDLDKNGLEAHSEELMPML